jgi:hypothetical protein
MRQLLLIAAAALPVLVAGLALAADKAEAKGKKVEFDVYDDYFESNKSGLKGETSFLAITDPDTFDKVFGKAAVMGAKQKFLPKDAFDTKLVVAVIHRGNAVWRYKVDQVTADGDTLNVQYEATSKTGGTATFHSPLVVAVDKVKYTSVAFIENGEKIGTAKIEKEKDK